MAKLGNYFGLCPLIDHRSLVGVSEDAERGDVIVTLGTNIAVRYTLSDQKLLHSLRTKEKFSSPIIYDKEQSKYVAVFSEKTVRAWSDDVEFIDKIKKINFSQHIHTIFCCGKKSFIVFKNGNVRMLKEAVENRKELKFEHIVDTNCAYIIDVLHAVFADDTYVGLVITSYEKKHLLWTRFNKLGQQASVCKILLNRPNVQPQGYVFYVDEVSVNFLSVWTDGRMYSAPLKDCEDSSDVGELFSIIDFVTCKECVSFVHLDHNYMGIYGCDPAGEGALLVIYNVKFKVVQSKQLFKLFTSGAKLWNIDKKLLFAVGQNLAVMPFYLDVEQLAALVGSHKITESGPDSDVSIIQKLQYVSWGKHSKSQDNLPKVIDVTMQDLILQGLSENAVFETLLSNITEKKNGEDLLCALNTFTNISEHCLVKALKLILNLEPEHFWKHVQSDVLVLKNLESVRMTELLDLIFAKPFNETQILPYIRSILSLDDMLSLLQYIYHVLSEDGHYLPSLNHVQSEAALIKWICVLLDANFQNIVLTGNTKVSEILMFFKKLMQEELNCTDDLRQVGSLLHKITRKKSNLKETVVNRSYYSIEEFVLY